MLSPNRKNTGGFVVAFKILAQPASRRLESSDDGAKPLQLLRRERNTSAL
jgi:hypothetical protein